MKRKKRRVYDTTVRFMTKRKYARARQRLASVIAGIVVFGTTYSLILPAVTVDEESADSVGMILELAETGTAEAVPAEFAEVPPGEAGVLAETMTAYNDIEYGYDNEETCDETSCFDAGFYEDWNEDLRWEETDSGLSDSGLQDSEEPGADPLQDFYFQNETYGDTYENPYGDPYGAAGPEEYIYAANGDEPLSEPIIEPASELTCEFTAEARGVDLRLVYPELLPPGTEVRLEEISDCDFDDYFQSADEEIRKYYEGRRAVIGQFWHVISPDSAGVALELRFMPEYYIREGQNTVRYILEGLREAVDSGNILLVDWSADAWHIYDPEYVGTVLKDDAITFFVTTDSLINPVADFGILILGAAEEADQELESVEGLTEELIEGLTEERFDELVGEVTEELDGEPAEESADEAAEEIVPEISAVTDAESKTESNEESDAASNTESDAASEVKSVRAVSESEGKPEPEKETEQIERTLAGAADSRTVVVPGTDLTLTISYGTDAGIPANAEITARPVDEEYYGTQAVEMVEAAEAVNAAEAQGGSAELLSLIDLTFSCDGKVIEPSADVSICVNFGEALPENEKIYAVHFPGSGEQPAEELPVVIEDTLSPKRRLMSKYEALPEEDSFDVSAADRNTDANQITDGSRETKLPGTEQMMPEVIETVTSHDQAVFSVTSFSYIAIVSYTVDFYFGNYEWHIEGGSEIRLSALFEALGIDRDAADAVSVEFTDPELLAVSEIVDEVSGARADWLLTSLQAFDTVETLTIRFADGAVVEIRVEDARDISINLIIEGSGQVKIGNNVYTSSQTITISQRDDGTNNNSFTATATGSKPFDHWELNGNRLEFGSTISSKALAVSSNDTLKAVFGIQEDEYYFTYTTEGSGTVDKAVGMSTDAVGATATPDDGNHFTGWRIGTDIVSTMRTFDPSLVTADGTVVTAVFAEGEETGLDGFTYTVNDPSAGIIQLVNSSGSPSGSNHTGTTVTDTLNAAGTDAARHARPAANSGYRFVNWTNEGSVYTPRRGSDENTIRPSVSEYESGVYTSGNFVANFVPDNDFLVTIVAGKGGSTTVGSDPDRHTIRYSELIAEDIGIIAWADDGYRSLGWVDEDGNLIGGLHEGDRRLYSDAVPTGRDCVVTAIFEEIKDFNIYYRTNGTLGTVSATHEIVHKDQEPIGSVATPKEGYQFIGWVDQNGVTVGWFPEFKPYGDLIYEAAAYTAVFESAAYSKILRVQAETENGKPLGYVISPDYETSVNGHIVTMNVTDFDTTPASMTAVAYEDWVFDHWELNGDTLKDPADPEKDLGATIPKGYDLSSYGVMDGTYNVLIAHFKVDDDPTVHKIVYKSDSGGTVTGLGGKTDENGDYFDTWIGSHSAGNIYGARASANDGYEFKGWRTEVTDASGKSTYMFPSYQAMFIPEGDLITDAVYTATYIPSKNMVGYNLNVADVPVTWTGPGSETDGIVVAAANQNTVTQWYSPMYYPNHFYGYLERFSLTTAIPEADGYYFIGWYNKNRPGSSGKEYIYHWPDGWGNYGPNVSHPKTDGNIIARGSRVDDEGHDMNNIFFPYSSGKNRYTFEAFYVCIDGDSKRLPYDGQTHQLVAEADLFEGSVEGTERFRKQLERMKNEGKYALGAVKYQLIDEDGNPVGDPTDSFERLDPGFYRVLAYADGHFDTYDFTVSKIITLEIYPAKLIIKKYWRNDEGMNIRPEELEVEKKRYDPFTQGYQNPDNAAVREAMEKNSQNQVETTADLYGPRTKTEEEISNVQKGDPDWRVEGDVWTREYENILVRDPVYLEDEQDSGWYVHFAKETVPEGYRLVNQTWERSSDRLTTTITFVNEPETKRITFEKRNNKDDLLENADFTLAMIRNFHGETLDPPVSVEFKLGTASMDLVYGYYRLTEDKAPDSYRILDEPVCFMIDLNGLHLTDAAGNILKDEEQAEITGTEDVVYLNSTVTIINGHTDIRLKKVDSLNPERLLAGAVFQLLDKDGRQIEETVGNLQSVTLKDGQTVNNALTTSDSGPFEIKGIPNGSYILREVQPPDNYAILQKDLAFTVKNGKAFDSNGKEADELTYTVENSPGVSLPNTGGPGRASFFFFGSLLMGCAALIGRQRNRLSRHLW